MVPVIENSPPEDVPPPLSMVLLTIVNSPPEDWANAMAVMRMVRMDSVVIIILFNELLPLSAKVYAAQYVISFDHTIGKNTRVDLGHIYRKC